MCFDILYKSFLKHFSIRNEPTEIWSKMYNGRHVECQLFLSDYNRNWIISTNFRKIFKYQISCKSV